MPVYEFVCEHGHKFERLIHHQGGGMEVACPECQLRGHQVEVPSGVVFRYGVAWAGKNLIEHGVAKKAKRVDPGDLGIYGG